MNPAIAMKILLIGLIVAVSSVPCYAQPGEPEAAAMLNDMWATRTQTNQRYAAMNSAKQDADLEFQNCQACYDLIQANPTAKAKYDSASECLASGAQHEFDGDQERDLGECADEIASQCYMDGDWVSCINEAWYGDNRYFAAGELYDHPHSQMPDARGDYSDAASLYFQARFLVSGA